MTHSKNIEGRKPRDYVPTPAEVKMMRKRWDNMKQRCFNPKRDAYKNYGGRGITVCDEWKDSFQAYLDYVGLPENPKHTIDRIDNDGNYEPGNIRWTTRSIQCINKRFNERLNKSTGKRFVTKIPDGRFRASVYWDKCYSVGVYDTIEAAETAALSIMNVLNQVVSTAENKARIAEWGKILGADVKNFYPKDEHHDFVSIPSRWINKRITELEEAGDA